MSESVDSRGEVTGGGGPDPTEVLVYDNDAEWWWDEKTVAQFLEMGMEWMYDAERHLTITLPHNKYGDSLHDYLCEIGEPLPPEDR